MQRYVITPITKLKRSIFKSVLPSNKIEIIIVITKLISIEIRYVTLIIGFLYLLVWKTLSRKT